MKPFLPVAIFLSFTVFDAAAASRYDVTQMTCAQVQARIAADGLAILSYRSSRVLGLPIYDHYASGQQYCPDGSVLSPAGVPTSDMKYCPVKRCFSSSRFVAR
ncbi:hypothetical protein MesoLjLc_20400 [Mesorhizobium sp. L-8-10]|uniref:hypothetical protein n=1 Tax=unclassified Mesorhizobium TaxID=325217 RepID=UPI0019266D6D|nr:MULTISPECIES: hypothetical protein [unclassified Mesorhizobium]BCH22296.1 hypothetical protein MesoLjLb_20810 [Mesorhizobium sp. L-8-3]BCH30110.1 hypothetical protein MesoLjLc_20400 [Mesorhizobium sp. L-8-10]